MKELKTAAILLVFALVTGAVTLALLPNTATPQFQAQPETPARHYEFNGRAFGTTYTIRWNEELSTEKVEALRLMIEGELREIDGAISIYRPDSELSKFNAHRSTTPVRVTPSTVWMVTEALGLRSNSDGAFDPTILPLLRVWGFGPYPRRKVLPKSNEIVDAQKHLGGVEVVNPTAGPGDTLRKSDPEAEVDLSGIGEGRALQSMTACMNTLQVQNCYIEFGGEMFARGQSVKGRPWRVGIERPEENAAGLWCIVELDGVGVSTSGNYRNFVEIDGRQYSHLIDPRTGKPIDHAGVSVSVIDASTVLADGWSTALMVLGPEQGYAKAIEKNLAALFIYRENGELKSRQTPAFEKYVVKDAKP